MRSLWPSCALILGCNAIFDVDALRYGDESNAVGTGGAGGMSATSVGGGAGHGGQGGQLAGPEDCQNGSDDDGDGQIDCADADCSDYSCSPSDGFVLVDALSPCPAGSEEVEDAVGCDCSCESDGDTACEVTVEVFDQPGCTNLKNTIVGAQCFDANNGPREVIGTLAVTQAGTCNLVQAPPQRICRITNTGGCGGDFCLPAGHCEAGSGFSCDPAQQPLAVGVRCSCSCGATSSCTPSLIAGHEAGNACEGVGIPGLADGSCYDLGPNVHSFLIEPPQGQTNCTPTIEDQVATLCCPAR